LSQVKNVYWNIPSVDRWIGGGGGGGE